MRIVFKKMAVQKTFRYISNWGITNTWAVDDRDTSSITAAINPGEPLKISGVFLIPLATGDPEIGTDAFAGLARKQSTESATVNGVVEVLVPIPGKSIIRGQATDSSAVDTDAEILALVGNYVNADNTTLATTNGDFTIDENEASDPNGNAFMIMRGNAVKGTLDCLVHVLSTIAGNQIGQTID